MDLRLEVEFSKTELVENIDLLKNQIDQLRPFSQEIEDKVMQKLRLEWNYHSNAIEGNRLNYGETVAFLMTGITAKGKSLKDHLDIRGHNEAILFLLSIIKDERNFTESDIRG
ncbi:MAG: Fic family protein, partial [Sphingobacteriaceae bacterium]